ncbi:hypothetical protein SAMN04488028_10977 [Reichenbachiella agariperforans]|uniref:Uncharacterized protein n=1 Tax=Reichenbachiella agariperforans TaxID=156994 RepID=A0A1M6VJT2_REIAG|nr:hypothetical protein [Reichenbachiella agariperforans]SHK81611.1 hypothetical protein SAMN04488028_10977 [Reichenbachiella agariperforans]
MKFLPLYTTVIYLLGAMTLSGQAPKNQSSNTSYEKVMNEQYVLYYPLKGVDTLLILFGGFPEDAESIEREFSILEVAKANEIAVLYMNYNRKLWLETEDKVQLTLLLETVLDNYDLVPDQIFFGGFSSGGNVTLLLADYLRSVNSVVAPAGLFVVDSPVDLLALYQVSQKNIGRNFSEVSVKEAIWLTDLLERSLGDPEEGIAGFESQSPYTAETHDMHNLIHLDGLKIRLYAEPDVIWWKENRQNDPMDLNAYGLEKLASQIQNELPRATVQYITSENKGYRSNGERHPHSWSIVDKPDLIEWMLNQ